MTHPDLFAADLTKWIDAQIADLGLNEGDEHYANARQAAERGWTAASIRPLIWPAGEPG